MMKEEFKMFLRSGFICTRELSRDMGENSVLQDIFQCIHVEILREQLGIGIVTLKMG